MAGTDTDWAGRVRNLSRGGLRLLLPRRFEPGTLLQIEVESVRDGDPVPLLARVIHVGPEAPGVWAVGCAFLRELGRDDLEALVNPDPLDG
jgi:hypothetical protein